MKATLFLPLFNAGPRLVPLLQRLREQSFDQSYEILVIDSGSSDASVRIAQDFGARVIQIPNREFQHGRTRNLAALEAKGEIVVYLTQSGLPADQFWLQRLLRHFSDPAVAGVYGKHLAWPRGNPYVARSVEGAFRWISPQDICLREMLAPGQNLETMLPSERDRLRFFSNANSALRRSFVLEHPFSEVDYAEDQLMGLKVLQVGAIKVYDPEAAVYHAHDFPLLRFLKRRFDEYSALGRLGQLRSPSLPGLVVSALRDIAAFEAYLWRRAKLSGLRRSGWTLLGPLYALADRVALYCASHGERLPERMKRCLSWELQQKRSARS